MKKLFLAFTILLLFVNTPVVHAQSLDIPIKGYGISFGNSKNFTGLRFNFFDEEVEQINGFNLSLGFSKKGQEPSGEFNGVSLMLLGIEARQLNGIHIGGELTADEINGMAVSAIVKAKTIKGITMGMDTIADEAYGISFNLVGHVFKKAKGIFIGTFFGGIKEELTGISIGLLARSPRSREYPSRMTGLVVAYNPAGKELNGVMVGGLSVEAYEINGLALGGVLVWPRNINGEGDLKALTINGIALGGVGVVADRLNGIAIGGFFNRIDKVNGISIGLVNYAKELNGIQIGLINYAGNNTEGLQWLPLMNAHFSF